MSISDYFRPRSCPGGSFWIRHSGTEYFIPERCEKDHILDQMRKLRNFYELDLLECMRSRLQAGGVAIDVGANIGNHSLYFAAVMGLRVVAFEPVQGNRDLLCRLIELNKQHVQIDVIATALSDQEGDVRLSAPAPGNSGTFRISGEVDGCPAKTERLDEALRRLGVAMEDVRVLKVDVEGHELQVLEGAPELLSQANPMIAIEVFTMSLFDSVLDKLRPLGYRAVSVHCATPTVLFSRDGVEAEKSVRARIARYQARR